MSDARAAPEVSVVIPCYNEEENAEAIAAAVIRVLEPVAPDFEIIFIDNASTDATVPIIKAMCARDPRVRLIANNRNYGQMRSPTYGIYQASGRAVIGLVADFQDPPELLPEFIRRWRAGADIVLGQRESEKAGLVLAVGRRIAYGFFERFADYKVIPNATGFGLYDRRVVDALARWNEPEPFFRGMLVESGYRLETVSHPRQLRQRGQSKNDFLRLFDFFLSALSGSSKKLLRLPLIAGIFLGIATGALLLATLVAAALGGPWLVLLGFTALQFNATLLAVFVGLVGEQVRLVAERTRGAPLVIERERINLPPARPVPPIGS